MRTTSRLLSVLMLGACIAAAPAAFAVSGTYGVHSGIVQGHARVGELRMAGTVPVASNLRTYTARHMNQRTRFQSRYNHGAYANLNQ